MPLHADVIQVDSAGLERLRAEGVAVIDVRRPDEWRKTGVIEGSHLLTFFDAKGHYDLDRWMPALTAIADTDQPVAFICRSGKRSGRVAHMLDETFGYRHVYTAARRHPGMDRRRAIHRESSARGRRLRQLFRF